MKVDLKIDRGPMKGKLFTFSEHDTFVFGRSPDTACPLPDDDYVSRNHFLLEINPPRVFIRDLGSLNGTIINGKKFGGRDPRQQRVEPGEQFSIMVKKNQWNRSEYETEMKHGDSIEVGDTIMKLSIFADVPCSTCGNLIDHSILHLYKRGNDYVCKDCREKERQEREQKAARERALKDTLAKKPQQPPVQKKAAPAIIGVPPVRARPRRNFQQEKKAADLIMKLLQEVALKNKPQVVPSFPNYEVVKLLGQGGMGAVYQAKDKRNGKTVAIKIIRPDHKAEDTAIRRFRDREMVISKSMRHQNIVACLDGDFVDGVYYLVMEMVEGSDVQRLIQQQGKIEVGRACNLMIDSLKGLEYIHKHKVVHRDLKPPNILLASAGKDWVPKIADFGLSKNLKSSSSITKQGDVAGSIPFMSPDQLLNFKNVTFAVDVYSMGATLYNMCTGTYSRDFPMNQDPLLVIIQGRNIPIRQRLPQVPAKIAEVIDRSLSQSPANRYQSAKEFRKALEKAL
jgi:eukaryotic-like serine/threonine-protein kinase